MDAAAYARHLKQLLPPGAIWRFEPDSWLSKTLLAIADELARVGARAANLLDEWDPRTAIEMLTEWERVLGVSVPAGATVSERQISIARQYVARGGQTAAYYIDLAARLGFVATVTDTGLGASTWRVNVDLAASSASYTLTAAEFRAGTARAGDRVRNLSVADLEAAILRAKPAHTVVTFLYT